MIRREQADVLEGAEEDRRRPLGEGKTVEGVVGGFAVCRRIELVIEDDCIVARAAVEREAARHQPAAVEVAAADGEGVVSGGGVDVECDAGLLRADFDEVCLRATRESNRRDTVEVQRTARDVGAVKELPLAELIVAADAVVVAEDQFVGAQAAVEGHELREGGAQEIRVGDQRGSFEVGEDIAAVVAGELYGCEAGEVEEDVVGIVVEPEDELVDAVIGDEAVVEVGGEVLLLDRALAVGEVAEEADARADAVVVVVADGVVHIADIDRVDAAAAKKVEALAVEDVVEVEHGAHLQAVVAAACVNENAPGVGRVDDREEVGVVRRSQREAVEVSDG